MQTSTFLMSTIALMAIMCSRVVDGAVVQDGWSRYCSNGAEATGAHYVCFHSDEGEIAYQQRKDLHQATIYRNPSNRNGMFDPNAKRHDK